MESHSQLLASFSCYTCKRRKVKCNRSLPSCFLCAKHEEICEYPTGQKRPGPKLGSTQKKRRGISTAGLLPPLGNSPSVNATSPGAVGRSPEIQRIDPNSASSHQHYDLRSRDARRASAWPADDSHLPSTNPVSRSKRSQPNDRAVSPAPDFSRMMYPSHETQTRPPTPSQSHASPDQPATVPGITMDTVCKGLGISRNVYMYLMKSYFSNMTTFTLFKPNGIETKFALMRSPVEAEALVAAMFAFSARFHSPDKDPSGIAQCPTPSYFAAIASRRLQDALDLYEDATPPFHLLQATILDVFYNISKSVRSKSWRYLGQAIRLGYDLKLHLLDIHAEDSPGEKAERDPKRWSLLEERRRAWWALWEMDVFASTIRRLPLAIDSTQNFTFLPAPDECWFQGVYQKSCFLAPEAGQRWKNISQAANTSAKAWLVVVNSLMHDAQQLVYSPLPASESSSSFKSKKDGLAIIANALYCTTSSMPPALVYEGQALDFHTKDTKARPRDVNCRQLHADVHSIYLMTQLVRFMIDHHVVCAQIAAAARAHGTQAINESRCGDSPSWSNYMTAAENVVAIVRNSAHSHVKYVNPLFTNTLWFAAASQIACRVVGPSGRAEALAASNYDLLELTIQRYTSFWGSSDILKPRLDRIEAELRNLMAQGARDADAGAAGGNYVGAEQPPGQSRINSTSLRESGLVGHGAQEVSMDAVQMSFVPLFPSGDDSDSLSQQMVFDDLEHFLPYGLEELWRL